MAFVLAATMHLGGMPAASFADDTQALTIADGVNPAEKGSITVSNPVEGVTYSAYKMLDLASFSDSDVATGKHASDAYSYVIKNDSKWLNFFLTGAGATYFDVDQENPVKLQESDATAGYYVVTPKTGFQLDNPFADTGAKDETTNAGATSSSLVQKFAQDALAYAKLDTNAVTADATGTDPASGTLALSSEVRHGARPRILPRRHQHGHPVRPRHYQQGDDGVREERPPHHRQAGAGGPQPHGDRRHRRCGRPHEPLPGGGRRHRRRRHLLQDRGQRREGRAELRPARQDGAGPHPQPRLP